MKNTMRCLSTLAIVLSSVIARADESSAWSAVDGAASQAATAAGALAGIDQASLGSIGATMDLSLQYMDGLVNGGKERDPNIESMITSAFSTAQGALQPDYNAAGGFESAFQQLQVAAAGLESSNFQIAEDAANGATTSLYSTEDYITQYGMDLMLLEFVNNEIAAAIQTWLGGSGGGGGWPIP